MEIIYQDRDIVVCIKPARVLSTDEPGGLPELLRQERRHSVRLAPRLPHRKNLSRFPPQPLLASRQV